jgi:glycine betaine/proline transport system permease protein
MSPLSIMSPNLLRMRSTYGRWWLWALLSFGLTEGLRADTCATEVYETCKQVPAQKAQSPKAWYTTRLPVGDTCAAAVLFVAHRVGQPVSNASVKLSAAIDLSHKFFKAIPVGVLIALLAILGGLFGRSWWFGVASGLGLFMIHHMGFFEVMMESLILAAIAATLATLIGLPLGVWAAMKPGFYRFMQHPLELGQSLHVLIIFVATFLLLKVGLIPGLLATALFAIYAPFKAAYDGISQVPRPWLEAGRSMGASNWQLFTKIELPHAWPGMLASWSKCLLMSFLLLVAAMVLGAQKISSAAFKFKAKPLAEGLEALLAVIIVALLLNRLLKQKRLDQNAKKT